MSTINTKTYSRKSSCYLKKVFVASNFNEMCRLCLSELDMVLTPIIQENNIPYVEWINYSVDVLIEEGDGLPPNICEECLGMVKQTYMFKKKCKASDLKLREHLEILKSKEEEKLNNILSCSEILNFDEESADLANFFTTNNLSEKECNKSSAVDSGGTDSKSQTKGKLQKSKCKKKENVEEFMLDAKTVDDTTEIPSNFPVPHDKKLNEEAEIEAETEIETEIEAEAEVEAEVEAETEIETENEKNVIKVQRYILKGEKKAEDQEEDLTECEVIPLETEKHSLELENANHDYKYQDKDSPIYGNNSSEMGIRIQEIYQLWDNEEEDYNEEDNKNKPMIINSTLEGEISEKNDKNNQIVVKLTTEDSSEFVKNENVVVIDVNIETDKQENQAFTSENLMEVTESESEKSKVFSCFSCYKQFSSAQKVKQHMAKCHQKPGTVYCNICAKSYTCKHSLKRHMSVHTGIKPFKCKTCGRKFSQGSILKRHVLTHENVKPYSCPQCNKSYTQKMNLIAHLKHHGLMAETENYSCPFCSKSFVHQSGVSRHIKIHKGIRFLCTHCKKSFKDSSSLNRHVKAIH